MSRLATHQRKMYPVSRESWKVVTGETLIDTKDGKQKATGLIYHWFKQWMRSTLKRSINSRGEPLTPGFMWLSTQHFNGRPMVDVAQELEGEALEGAGRGVETHDETKGPLIPWMRRIMLQHLNDELERWADASASVNDQREEHRSVDMLLEDADNKFEAWSRSFPNRGLGRMDLSTSDPADAIEVDEVDRELCDLALSVLSAMEAEALRRFSEGESYNSIARNLCLSGATSAHRIVDRARLRAREALLS